MYQTAVARTLRRLDVYFNRSVKTQDSVNVSLPTSFG